MIKSPLRDLARQIEEVARAHPAYSQAHETVRVLTGYLLAMARIEELNAATGGRSDSEKLVREISHKIWMYDPDNGGDCSAELAREIVEMCGNQGEHGAAR